ncbi:MAG: ATP-binding protein [Clostridia bacterium]|nr:ATP-binding protein [Clostridia bacterium]
MSESNFIKDIVFKENSELYNQLFKLNKKIKRKKKSTSISKPFIIEFMGPARSGKTSCITMVADFFRKYNYSVEVVDEEHVDITKIINNDYTKKKETNSLDYTKLVIEEKKAIFDYASKLNVDIIIFDRGINDEFNWLKAFSDSNMTDKYLEDYTSVLADRKVDLLIIQKCNVLTCLKRKHFNTLSLLPNKWTNYETLNNYNQAITQNNIFFKKHSNLIYTLNTEKTSIVNTSIKIANKILDIIGN